MVNIKTILHHIFYRVCKENYTKLVVLSQHVFIYICKDNKTMGIGTNLKRLRINTTKLSQQDIANQLNVDRITYINWENESNDIKSQYIPELAKIFKVEIKDLFEDDNKINIINNFKTTDNSTGAGILINISDKETAEKLTAQIEKLVIALGK